MKIVPVVAIVKVKLKIFSVFQLTELTNFENSAVYCVVVDERETIEYMPPPNDDTIWGAIHSAKISGNFGPKLNGLVRSNWKSYEKKGPYLFKRWTTNLVYRLLFFLCGF